MQVSEKFSGIHFNLKNKGVAPRPPRRELWHVIVKLRKAAPMLPATKAAEVTDAANRCMDYLKKVSPKPSRMHQDGPRWLRRSKAGQAWIANVKRLLAGKLAARLVTK